MVVQNEIVIAQSKIILVGDSNRVAPSYATNPPIKNGENIKTNKKTEGLLRLFFFENIIFFVLNI
jgi:hypothetical protein